MSIITIGRRPADSPFAEPANQWDIAGPDIVGQFDTDQARYWQGDGKRETRTAAGAVIVTDRSAERLWHTDQGRWVLNIGTHGPCYQLDDIEADEWLTENGYPADVREAYARRLGQPG